MVDSIEKSLSAQLHHNSILYLSLSLNDNGDKEKVNVIVFTSDAVNFSLGPAVIHNLTPFSFSEDSSSLIL